MKKWPFKNYLFSFVKKAHDEYNENERQVASGQPPHELQTVITDEAPKQKFLFLFIYPPPDLISKLPWFWIISKGRVVLFSKDPLPPRFITPV